MLRSWRARHSVSGSADLHQAEKTTPESAETTETGLRTVQHMIKPWEDSDEDTWSGSPTENEGNPGSQR